jgi:hypothetical protein
LSKIDSALHIAVDFSQAMLPRIEALECLVKGNPQGEEEIRQLGALLLQQAESIREARRQLGWDEQLLSLLMNDAGHSTTRHVPFFLRRADLDRN